MTKEEHTAVEAGARHGNADSPSKYDRDAIAETTFGIGEQSTRGSVTASHL